MVQIAYRAALPLDYCPDSGGPWFDAGELKALLKQERNLRFALDRKAAAMHSEKEPVSTRVDRRKTRRHRSAFCRYPISFYGPRSPWQGSMRCWVRR